MRPSALGQMLSSYSHLQIAQHRDGTAGQHRGPTYLFPLFCTGRRTLPVRIRNLSKRGALIDVSASIEPGTKVKLCRGSPLATGTIVLNKACKAGVKFDNPVDVTDWLPTGLREHQAKVNAFIRQVRKGRLPERPEEARASEAKDVYRDVQYLATMVERVAEVLGEDPYLIINHAVNLQKLEVTVQNFACSTLRRTCPITGLQRRGLRIATTSASNLLDPRPC